MDKGATSIKCIADLLIKNGLLVDPLRETAERTDLSIKDGRILALSDNEAREVIDAEGCYVSCGFIESHLHVEGLHLLPEHYFRAFLAHGTTTIVTDLHEIANAGGMHGLRWYLSLIDEVPLDLFVMAPSCVPSSPHEWGAAKIGAGDLRRLQGMRRVIGLGEVMDMRAVMRRQKTIMRKIALFEGKPVDGHAPGLTGTISTSTCRQASIRIMRARPSVKVRRSSSGACIFFYGGARWRETSIHYCPWCGPRIWQTCPCAPTIFPARTSMNRATSTGS